MIANTGDTNSFAEIYWEDKIMPFIGGNSGGEREPRPGRGSSVPSEKIYRCPADLSERKPFIDPTRARSTASRTAPVT